MGDFAKPLSGDEIRILYLGEDTPGSPQLVGFLRKVRLSDPARLYYEPVSYTWKDCDRGPSDEPSISGTEEKAHSYLHLRDTDISFEIQSNCAKALSCLRRPKDQRKIWIDSLCINQDDDTERSHQVRHMHKIYAEASVVLVYLGQADDDSNMAMLLLNQPDRYQQSNVYEKTSIRHLFQRPYFQRLWIVQEVALANTLEIYCGSAEPVHISAFARRPLEAVLDSGLSVPAWLKHSKNVEATLQRIQNTTQAEQLLSLIFDTALCQCKDDRDKIFALFSLLKSNSGDLSSEGQLLADYKLSPEEVYTGTAAFLAMNGLTRAVLMLATILRSDSTCLPSWTPDWSLLPAVGSNHPKLLENTIIESGSVKLDAACFLGVSRTGVITITGIPLGPVKPLLCSRWDDEAGFPIWKISLRDRFEVPNGRLRNNQGCDGGLMCRYGPVPGSIWILNQGPETKLWECHFEFPTRCLQTSDLQHIAVMLPNYSTILILRCDSSSSNQYTLVDIVEPKDWGKKPYEWERLAAGCPYEELYVQNTFALL